MQVLTITELMPLTRATSLRLLVRITNSLPDYCERLYHPLNTSQRDAGQLSGQAGRGSFGIRLALARELPGAVEAPFTGFACEKTCISS
jgi:hypothetical protein